MEKLEAIAIQLGHATHDELGPGLLKQVYQTVLAERLGKQNLEVRTNKKVKIVIDDQKFDEGFRYDLLIEKKLLIQVLSAKRIEPIDEQHLITYLRLLDLPFGLVMNFGALTFKQGVRRIVNHYHS